MADAEQLLRRAQELDDEAVAYRGPSPKADALRQEAATLRIDALGPKSYPVLVCSTCFRLTGWVGADGSCAHDIRRRLERADPNRLGVPDLRPRLRERPVPFTRRLKRTLGVGSERDRIREWLTKIDPDETGPVAPEDGWGTEWPVKFEEAAPEGTDLLVVFDVKSLRFEYGAWRTAETTPGGKPMHLVPREFAASLDIASLAEAWNDFEQEVAAHNTRVWRTEAARRDGSRERASELRAAVEAERGTSDLLGD